MLTPGFVQGGETIHGDRFQHRPAACETRKPNHCALSVLAPYLLGGQEWQEIDSRANTAQRVMQDIYTAIL